MAEEHEKPHRRAKRRLGTWPHAQGESVSTEESNGPSG
jgi:hypothetical protein